MKKLTAVLFTLLIAFNVYSMSFVDKSTVNSFDSYPMLNEHYDKSAKVSDNSMWADMKVELITVSKADPLYSWFGHCAVLVTPPSGNSLMFDYGTFAFGKGFYANFAMGRLWYSCTSSYGEQRLRQMKNDRRTVSAVELNLTPSQKYAFVNFLLTNSSDGYDVYLYNHYTDNCATRIRDLLDYVTDGDFKSWAQKQDGLSFRKQTSRILINSPIVMWALDFLQSGNIDKKASLWDEMFLPENLEKAVLEYGKLGTKHTYYSDFRNITDRPQNSPVAKGNWVYSLLLSALIAVSLCVVIKKSKVLYKIESFAVNLVFGLMGSLLFFMMTFTSHNVTYLNENILFINPVLIAMAVITLIDSCKNVLRYMYKGFAVITVLLVALKVILPSVFVQCNWTQIAIMLPYYVINGFGYKYLALDTKLK